MRSTTRLGTLALASLVALAAGAGWGAALPDRILVKYRPGVSAAKRAGAVQALQGRVLRELSIIDAQLVQFEGMTVQEAVARAQQDPAVQYAEPDFELSVTVFPSDPRFSDLHGLHNTGQFDGIPGSDIQAPEAWDLFTGDPGLKIGVIDTGIDPNHPDLLENIWTNPGEIPGNRIDDDHNGYVDDVHGYDVVNHDGDPFDDFGHGVHVAGTIGATGNNGVGITGVVWRCKIVGIKFLNGSGRGDVAGAIAALQYAIAAGCRITNNSYGGGDFSQAWLDAIRAAGQAGLLFVAAAGNSYVDNDAEAFYPAGFDSPNIVSVAATNQFDELAEFSNFGATTVDLAAPGEAILSLLPGGGYFYLSGTSMASPHVAGVAALILGRYPGLDVSQVKNQLLVSAEPLPTLAGLVATGGRVNALRAVEHVDLVPPAAIADLAVTNPGSTTLDLLWTAPGDDGMEGDPWAYDVRYDTRPITEATFAAAPRAAPPAALARGSQQRGTLRGLAYSTAYWVAVRTTDEFNNTSSISNLAQGTTLAAPHARVTPAALEVTLPTGLSATRTVELANTAAGTLDFEVIPPRVVPADRGAAGTPVTAGEGGPDTFGYRWIDSDAPDGPVYAWHASDGAGSSAGDESMSVPVALQFAFPFYGANYNSVLVCSNGYLSFTDGVVKYANGVLPSTTAPANLIAPFWDDLIRSTIRIESRPEKFVVTWEQGERFRSPGRYTFQTILTPDGEIRFQYASLGEPATSATVGVQDAAKSTGLTVASNTAYLHPGLAVRIVPLRQWITAGPAAGRVMGGAAAPVTVRLDASRVQPGRYTSAVLVNTNDIGQPQVQIPVVLNVSPAPDLVAAPRPLDFGSVFVGAQTARNLRVRNEGSADLHVQGFTAPPGVTVQSGPLTLRPGALAQLTVVYQPPVAVPLAGTIVITSDDPDAAESTVPLRGAGLVPPNFAVSAESIAVSLQSNRTQVRTVRITNGGGSPFVWTAAPVLDVSPAATISVPDAAPWAPLPEAALVAAALAVPKAGGAALPGPAPAAHGGPDGFGYRYEDSDEPTGPAFDWVDIRGTGTRIPFSGDDENLGPFPIGFAFPFYGETFNAFRAASNGFLSFTSRAATYANTPLPAAAPAVPENLLAVFWDDLDFTAGGSAWYAYDGTRLVVQFQDVRRHGETAPNSFAALLYPDGRIVYQYAALQTGVRNSATIGIQNAARTTGLQVAFNAAFGRDGLAVRFTPPARFLRVTPGGGTIVPGGFVDLALRFDSAALLSGGYGAALRISGNDPRLPVFDVPAHLTVIGVPDVAVSPDTLDYGVVDLGYPQVRQVQVRNRGGEPLFVRQVGTGDTAFTPRNTSFTVPPFGNALLEVRFTPARTGSYTDVLFLLSDDPDQPGVPVRLRAVGREPPDVVVDGASLLTARVTAGTPAVRVLGIRNTGRSPLEYTLTVRGRGVPVAARATAGSPPRGAVPSAAAPRAAAGVVLTKDSADPRAGIRGGGGPDGYGNRWRDSDNAPGPAFAWIDASSGSTIPFGRDDETRAGIPLGFDFPFYGKTFRTINICTNGWLSFSSTDSVYSNQPLPDDGPRTPRALLAPLWDDYVFAAGSAVFVLQTAGRCVVEWKNVAHFISGQRATFEAVLSRDGRILFQYLETPASGSSPTVGIQDDTAGDGLLVAYNTPYVHDGLAVEIRPGHDWLRPAAYGGMLAPGEAAPIEIELGSGDLPLGRYEGNVTVTTNDPDEGSVSLPVILVVATPSGVEAGAAIAPALRAEMPRRGVARLRLRVPGAATVPLDIYDVRGTRVARLVVQAPAAGTYEIPWTGAEGRNGRAAAGLYFVRARVAGMDLVARLLLVR